MGRPFLFGMMPRHGVSRPSEEIGCRTPGPNRSSSGLFGLMRAYQRLAEAAASKNGDEENRLAIESKVCDSRGQPLRQADGPSFVCRSERNIRALANLIR